MNNQDLNKIIFVITEGCDSSCKYCYNHFDKKSNFKKMNIEEIPNIIKFLKSHIKTEHNMEFLFIGGEPLTNFEFIKKMTDEIKKQNYISNKFKIATNLININKEIIDFFVENKFHVAVSMDGLKETHEKNRKNWDIVINNYFNLRFEYSKHNIKNKLAVNSVATNNNYKDLLKNHAELKKADITQKIDICAECNWTLSEIKDLADNIINISRKDINFKNNNIKIKHKSKACLDLQHAVAIGPDYKLYFCHRTINGESFGDIYNGYYNIEYYKKELNRENNLPLDCIKCPALDYCLGGCRAIASKDKIYYCEYIKNITENLL